MEGLRDCPERLASSVDWAAKKAMLEQYMESEATDWRDPALRSLDLEYHNVDPAAGLHGALVEMGAVEARPAEVNCARGLVAPKERIGPGQVSRVTKFPQLWHCLLGLARVVGGRSQVEIHCLRTPTISATSPKRLSRDFIAILRGKA